MTAPGRPGGGPYHAHTSARASLYPGRTVHPSARLLPAVCLAAACAAAHPRPARVSPPRLARWHGVVTFEARHPTPQGASSALEVRPARRVELQALGAAGEVLGHGWTDNDGRFSMEAPPGALELAVLAHALWNGHDVAVSSDRLGRGVHTLRRPLGPPGAAMVVAATDDAPGGPAGAFHILDTLLRGVDAAGAWTHQTLPPLWAYWGRGVTDRWSYYRGERPAHSGRFAIELLGGSQGRQRTTDTDEHDEAIILHEVGHFVFDRLSTNSSAGGMHPGTSLLDPGLAWEEGRATWFGTAVRGSPLYQDTIGIEPEGRLRVDRNLEATADGPRGNGSEASVSQVLWELADGADGLPDTDHDGVALGPAAILEAMMAERAQPGAYPCLEDFLQLLVQRGAVDQPSLAHLLAVAGQPDSLRTTAGGAGVGGGGTAWPLDLALPGRAEGKVDGLTDPAPSGGRARPENGLDAERVYRVHLATRARLVARLLIAGSGLPSEHTDLDLEVRSDRADLVAASRGSTDHELVSRVVDAGYYMVYVRDGGTGNRAGFTLDVTATPVP